MLADFGEKPIKSEGKARRIWIQLVKLLPKMKEKPILSNFSECANQILVVLRCEDFFVYCEYDLWPVLCCDGMFNPKPIFSRIQYLYLTIHVYLTIFCFIFVLYTYYCFLIFTCIVTFQQNQNYNVYVGIMV